jgi:hypothetical protein
MHLSAGTGSSSIIRWLTPRSVAAEAVVRLPANTSERTSIRCKSRALTVNHPKVSLPGLLQKSEGRHFYFAEIGHFSFALTFLLYRRLVISLNHNENALATTESV